MGTVRATLTLGFHKRGDISAEERMARSLPAGQDCVRYEDRGGEVRQAIARGGSGVHEGAACESVGSRFLRLDYLMYVDEGKEMRG